MEGQTNKEAERAVTAQVTLGVFRRLDNRLENLDDDSPRGLELHNLRKGALHEVFGKENGIVVLDWGQTDDTQSHEFVELVVGLVGLPVFKYAVLPAVKFLGKKLAEKAVDEASSELVKAVVSWLGLKQKENKIQDFVVTLPDKTEIKLYPPQLGGALEIRFANGKLESINYWQPRLAATS
jgi:hypothetical protein